MIDKQRKAFIKEMYSGIKNQVLVKEYMNIRELAKSPKNDGKYTLVLEVLKELIVERGLPEPL